MCGTRVVLGGFQQSFISLNPLAKNFYTFLSLEIENGHENQLRTDIFTKGTLHISDVTPCEQDCFIGNSI